MQGSGFIDLMHKLFRWAFLFCLSLHLAAETHWSLVPPKRPSSGKSIDEFIEKRLSEKGLKQSEEASKRILIRRVYLVMHGLPPTPEQVEAFLRDLRENAW